MIDSKNLYRSMQNREAAGSARYLTLAMASVPRDAFPKKHVRGLPPYELPLILLARLAVDRHFVGRGLGHALISGFPDQLARRR